MILTEVFLMRDFNDFKTSDAAGIGNNGGDKAAIDMNGNIAEQFSALASAYEGKNADEIMKAILTEAERGRKNGTLSDDDIDNFAALVLPMINPEQQKTLEKVVKRLKKK